MIYDILIYILTFVLLSIACYTDIKRLEVDLWVSGSLIVGAFFLRVLQAVLTQNYTLIAITGFSLAFFFLVGYVMHILIGFGGADVLLLAGVGAGFVKSSLILSLGWIGFFFLALAVLSGIYGYVMLELRKKQGLFPFVPVLLSSVFFSEVLWVFFG